MTLTLYGCGYNGFTQISGFQTQDLEGWLKESCQTGHQKHNDNENTSYITSPAALMFLDKNVQVKNAIFTWSSIAISLHKDGKDVSLVSGSCKSVADIENRDRIICDASATTADKNVCSHTDGEAISATDTQIFLRLAKDEKNYVCLQNGDHQPLSVVFEDGPNKADKPDSDSLSLQLYSTHTDVYYSKGVIEFGKLICADPEAKRKGHFSGDVHLSPIDFSVSIAQVSCGKEHVLILSTFGSIYTCGIGSRGQLGHGDVEMEPTPRLLEALEGVPMLSCQAGGWHSACVSASGDLYTWGWNERGQLGLASCTDSTQEKQASDQSPGLVTEPHCVTLPEDINVKTVACGSRHTLVLSACGQVFSSGWNAYGQLGLLHTNSQSAFLRITSLGSCLRIFAGHWGSLFLCSK